MANQRQQPPPAKRPRVEDEPALGRASPFIRDGDQTEGQGGFHFIAYSPPASKHKSRADQRSALQKDDNPPSAARPLRSQSLLHSAIESLPITLLSSALPSGMSSGIESSPMSSGIQPSLVPSVMPAEIQSSPMHPRAPSSQPEAMPPAISASGIESSPMPLGVQSQPETMPPGISAIERSHPEAGMEQLFSQETPRSTLQTSSAALADPGLEGGRIVEWWDKDPYLPAITALCHKMILSHQARMDMSTVQEEYLLLLAKTPDELKWDNTSRHLWPPNTAEENVNLPSLLRLNNKQRLANAMMKGAREATKYMLYNIQCGLCGFFKKKLDRAVMGLVVDQVLCCTYMMKAGVLEKNTLLEKRYSLRN
ncbi:MAG: hypothetical protein M1816_005066 [Peltula sp. TS41687]|nr:MAG: hypothetical protein M1816_005066 [Peltula sp. TS41687]